MPVERPIANRRVSGLWESGVQYGGVARGRVMRGRPILERGGRRENAHTTIWGGGGESARSARGEY